MFCDMRRFLLEEEETRGGFEKPSRTALAVMEAERLCPECQRNLTLGHLVKVKVRQHFPQLSSAVGKFHFGGLEWLWMCHNLLHQLPGNKVTLCRVLGLLS